MQRTDEIVNSPWIELFGIQIFNLKIKYLPKFIGQYSCMFLIQRNLMFCSNFHGKGFTHANPEILERLAEV